MRYLSYASAVFLCTFLFLGCNKSQSPTKSSSRPVSPIMQINISQPVAANISSFSFDFFHALQSTQSLTDNIFVSPLSLHMDLGMLLNGAEGNTYTELANALNLQDLTPSQINEAYQVLLKDLPIADKQVQFGLYNSMWYKNTYSVEQDYTNILHEYFQADVTGLPFAPSDITPINKWASDKTNNKITNVVDAFLPGELMFLINALYFKGDWAVQFDKNKTRDYPFHLEDGSSKQVKMMFNTDTFHFAATAAFNAIQLPYGNGQFMMTVILPNGNNQINEVLKGLNGDAWQSLQQEMPLKTVEIGLPRFKVPKYSVTLQSTLEMMGVKDAFNADAANLSKIIKGIKLFVDRASQFTYLNVDEVGTEAAAVTVVGVGTTYAPPPPPSLICDHSFGIVISEKTSNTILFIGRIMNPDSQ